jgi:DNA-binding transcriptional LysR family regulator
MLNTVRSLDLKLLKVFVAVVENGGFSAAQASLNVGQSTISGYMRDLEVRLGMRLCNRGISGFALTEDGRAVYDISMELFRSIGEASTKLRTQSGIFSGELRIAIADALYGNPDFKLVHVVKDLHAISEDITITLSAANPLQLEQGILSNAYHIGIHTFPSHVPGIGYQKLFEEEQVLCCGRGHELFGRCDVTPNEIQPCGFVRRSYYGGSLNTGKFKPNIVTATTDNIEATTDNIEATADNIEATAILISSGLYLGHLPRHWVQHWIAEGALWEIEHPDLCYVSTFEVASKVSEQGSKLIATSLEVIKKRMCAIQ